MTIRTATEADWPAIWPFWREIVEAGETYAYPSGATSELARGWWFDGSRVTSASWSSARCPVRSRARATAGSACT